MGSWRKSVPDGTSQGKDPGVGMCLEQGGGRNEK